MMMYFTYRDLKAKIHERAYINFSQGMRGQITKLNPPTLSK